MTTAPSGERPHQHPGTPRAAAGDSGAAAADKGPLQVVLRALVFGVVMAALVILFVWFVLPTLLAPAAPGPAAAPASAAAAAAAGAAAVAAEADALPSGAG